MEKGKQTKGTDSHGPAGGLATLVAWEEEREEKSPYA